MFYDLIALFWFIRLPVIKMSVSAICDVTDDRNTADAYSSNVYFDQARWCKLPATTAPSWIRSSEYEVLTFPISPLENNRQILTHQQGQIQNSWKWGKWQHRESEGKIKENSMNFLTVGDETGCCGRVSVSFCTCHTRHETSGISRWDIWMFVIMFPVIGELGIAWPAQNCKLSVIATSRLNRSCPIWKCCTSRLNVKSTVELHQRLYELRLLKALVTLLWWMKSLKARASYRLSH